VSYTVTRYAEIDQLLQAMRGYNCASLVGLSNTGKSTLLRTLLNDEVTARYIEFTGRRVAFVYIDCNGMLELSGQGLYELVLRSVQETIRNMDDDLARVVTDHYRQVVEPDTQFLVPLNFNNAMQAIIESGHRDLVLLLDEFDDVFDTLDGRVFLNLRALKDKYPSNLIYVTATLRRLGSKRSDEQTAEFIELSAAHTITLRPLTRPEADQMAQGLARDDGIQEKLSQNDLDFLWQEAGGHPRLLRAALSHLIEHQYRESEPVYFDDLSQMHGELVHEVTIRNECTRLWRQLGPHEREALLAIASDQRESLTPQALQSLREWGLVTGDENPVVFGSLMAEFVRRQAAIPQETQGKVWMDADAGEVWVEGALTSPLTELEFKLMALLYARINKLTDKYQIVETVWGVDYIDEVDDSRIEKLISRLRAKIEPDSGDPRYIVTVRGRGYKLMA
jgi:GTP-binding protein EngB required for normal cell division